MSLPPLQSGFKAIPPTFLRDLIAECTIPKHYSYSQASIISFAFCGFDSIMSAACTREGRFGHKIRGIPRGMQGSGSASRLLEVATWGFLSRKDYPPVTSSQAEAPSVGYLGFRARISCPRCTFCENKQGTYRISDGYRRILAYWSSCRAGLLTQLDCSTARTPQSSKENEAQILN